jgi:hypothetical protein
MSLSEIEQQFFVCCPDDPRQCDIVTADRIYDVLLQVKRSDPTGPIAANAAMIYALVYELDYLYVDDSEGSGHFIRKSGEDSEDDKAPTATELLTLHPDIDHWSLTLKGHLFLVTHSRVRQIEPTVPPDSEQTPAHGAT